MAEIESLFEPNLKMPESSIHETALIDERARIGKSVIVGPYSIIGPDVIIDDNTVVDNHVTVKGKTRIGKNNSIGPYTSIGLSAQDKAHRDEPTEVVIGDFNEIREYVSINRGTLGGTGVTKIGNHNQIMVGSHFGHDVSVGDHCMFANNTTFAGHVQVGSYVVTGGMSGIHQYCRIGNYSMLGSYSALYQDLPPYLTCEGRRAQAIGLNTIGLKRNGFDKEEINQIQQIFNIFFSKGFVPKKAIEVMQAQIPSGKILDVFVQFVAKTSRGIVAGG